MAAFFKRAFAVPSRQEWCRSGASPLGAASIYLTLLLTHFLPKQPAVKCRFTEDSEPTVPKARLSVFCQNTLLYLSFWRVKSEKNREIRVGAMGEDSMMRTKPS